jgi:hypothetical protein
VVEEQGAVVAMHRHQVISPQVLAVVAQEMGLIPQVVTQRLPQVRQGFSIIIFWVEQM